MKLFDSYISDESKLLVKQVLDSGFLNQGPMVKRFESELADFGLLNPVTVNSCTSALHIALECCDVRGKEVILPAQTFISTGLAVLIAGATPVFVDICKDGNIDLADIKRKINSNTAAIIVVHWGGNPCDMERINKFANYRNIPVIEDAAHAFGASIGEKVIGAISDYTCFSFQAIKFLTTGDGGAICCKNPDNLDRIQKLKWFGINKNHIVRSDFGQRINNIDSLGFKYNMNDIQAAIGIGNLHQIPERLKQRRAVAVMYYNNGVEDVGYQKPIMQCPSCWLYTIVHPNVSRLCTRLLEENIPFSKVDTGIDTNTVFNSTTFLPTQRWFDEHQLSLPIHEDMTEEDVIKVCNIVKETR